MFAVWPRVVRRSIATNAAAISKPPKLNDFVKIVEVGPRDGLQNEKKALSVETKLELIRKLSNSGLSCVEATAFVSPKWVPQMANAAEIMTEISSNPSTYPSSVSYPVLAPNLKGFEAALKFGAKEIAVFGAASETFSQKNINCSIEESLKRFIPVCEAAKKEGILVRGYVSCVVGCPFEGAIDPSVVSYVAKELFDMGCYEISLGDTIGVGTPYSIAKMVEKVARDVDTSQLAIHAHDTYGQALVNIYQCLQLGIRTVDSSIGGLGGCPYAKGATGNVATEDVIYMLKGLGYDYGKVDLNELARIGDWISIELGRPNASRAGSAILKKLKQ